MRNKNNPAATDAQLCVAATEYLWDGAGSNCSHVYLTEPATNWLKRYGSRVVLDLGCGNGAFTGLLSANGYDAGGCDVSDSGIAIARREYPHIEFFQHDLGRMLPSHCIGRYDAVVSLEVLEHLLLPRSLTRNAMVALRPGGLLLLSTPFHGYWKNLALALFNRFDEHWHPLRDYGHVKFFSESTLRALVEESGFKVHTIEKLGRVPCFACSMLLVATKPA